MMILYIAPDIPVPHTGKFLGGTTHVLKVSEGLIKKGNNVFIISRRVSGQPKFEKIFKKIYTRRFYRGLLFPVDGHDGESGEKRILSRLLERMYFLFYRIMLTVYVIWLLSSHHFDLILERNSAKGIGAFPARLFHIRTVIEVIDPDYSKLQLKCADKILAYTRDIIPGEFHKKTILTHAGVDASLFADANGREIRDRYGLDRKVIIYVGELSTWHGVDTLIDIAAKLRDVKLLMVGKKLDLLQDEVKKKGIAENFVFAGFIKHEEIPKYISAADVAVAPYKRIDNMGVFYFSPIKIFEYMACGKAVVASDLEIIRDIIRDTNCGLLAKAGDIEDFAQKIQRLLDDVALREQLGENGRKAVRMYSWDEVAQNILG